MLTNEKRPGLPKHANPRYLDNQYVIYDCSKVPSAARPMEMVSRSTGRRETSIERTSGAGGRLAGLNLETVRLSTGPADRGLSPR